MLGANTENLIGIDGGGTNCRIALIWQGVRHEVQVGAANAFTDLTGTVAIIRDGLTRVANAAGQGLEQLSDVPAYIGLAGVISPDIARKVTAELPLTRATVSDDRTTALVGALDNADGAVASIGTGSFLARQSNGQPQLIGGYGLRLGDQASGAWLGRQLLIRILQIADGLQPHSHLTRAVFARFNNNTSDIIAFGRTAAPQDYGSLAPEIVQAASAEDQTAQSLMQQGVDYITSGLKAMGWQSDQPLVLLGGVAASYAKFLPTDTAAAITAAKGSALDGALTLAARAIK